MNKNSNWESKAIRFVGFFDIMGFKDYAYTHRQEELEDRVIKLSNLERILQSDSTNNPSLKAMQDNVDIIVVSDSLIIASKNDSLESFMVLYRFTSFLFEYCFSNLIPIKGAVSHGLFTFDKQKSIYVGKPLINAYSLESTLAYYGCILDHNTEKAFNKFDSKLYSKNYFENIVSCKVPTKSGNINYYAFKVKETSIDLIKGFYSTVSGDARKYIDNSIEIYSTMNNKSI